MASKKLQKLIKNLGFTRAEKKQIAEYALELLRNRTIAGYDENNKPFKKLANSTIKSRMKDSNLSDRTSPGESNLVRTGEMIDSLESKIEGRKSNDLSFRIQVKNKKNRDKLSFNAVLGRSIMGMDDDMKDSLMEFIEEMIYKKLDI